MSMERGKTTSFSFRKWTLVRFDTIAFRPSRRQLWTAANCRIEKPSSSPSTTNQIAERSVDRSGANACFLSREETHGCEEMISAFGSVLIRRSSQPFSDLRKSTGTFGI